MKNLEQVERAIHLLTERMNRVEAVQAKQTPRAAEKIMIDIDTSAVTRSIAQIEAALQQIEARKIVTLNGK